MRPPGDLEQRQHSADETGSAVSLTVEYVSLDSAEAAATLCRQDEDAYRAACGREFRLRLKSPPKKLRNGGTPPTIREGYLDIITHASAMKRRRKIILANLEHAGPAREYIRWELQVATEKLQSRARRVESVRLALHEWSTAKGFDPWASRLSAILASALGRRAWRNHMENQVLASKTANSSHHVSPLPSRSRSGSAGGGNSGGDVGGRGLYTRSTTGEENLALVPSSSRQLHGKATTQDTANLPPPALETMFEDDIQDERRSPTVGTDAGSVTTGDPGPGDVAEQEVASAIAK
ncbi:unnamed protein product, partial [Sphacelaria rigidula]